MPDEPYDLVLNAVISRFLVDEYVDIIIGPLEDPFAVRLEAGFRVVHNGERHVGDAAENASLAPLLLLFCRSVARLLVTQEGNLSVLLDDGSLIEAVPRDDAEAWEVRGPDGLLIVCPVGGGRVTWSSRKE